MRTNEYYQTKHEKEWKSLLEIIKRMRDGVYWITSVTVTKELVGNGYRMVVYFRDKK